MMIRTLLALSLSTTTITQTLVAQTPAPYLEADGIVVFEAEDQNFDTTYFKLETSIAGYSGTGYLVGQINSYNTPGRGIVSCPIKITNAGRYQLSWKSRITTGDSNTDANDTWGRILDSSDIPLAPVANDNHPSSSQWHKVYMNNANAWIYDASNKDNDPHSLSWQLEAGKSYTFQFSVRSADHGLDRIVLWDTSRYAFANTTTGKSSKLAQLDPLPKSFREGEIAADSDNDGLPDEWESLYGSSSTSIDPSSDDDKDSLPALLEFALGSDPTTHTPAPTISKVEIDGTSYLSYNYTRSLTAIDHVDLRPYYSHELSSWKEDELSIEPDWKTINETTVGARALLPSNTQHPRHFFQLITQKK